MVEVIYDGNLGNNLFQYCFGRILAERLGYALNATPIPGFPRTNDHVSGKSFQGQKKIWLHGQKVNLDFLAEPNPEYHIVLAGYFQRFEYYEKFTDTIREWLYVDDLREDVSPNDLVVGIRRGKDYIPQHGLPLSYYEQAITLMDFERMYICSNTSDPFIRHFQKKYGAIVRPPDALDNLRFIKSFNKIIISNSTFLWWAAYLSNAEQIIMPIPGNGFWSTDPISKNIDLKIPFPNFKYVEADKYRSEFFFEKIKVDAEKIANSVKFGLKQALPFLKNTTPNKGIKFTED